MFSSSMLNLCRFVCRVTRWLWMHRQRHYEWKFHYKYGAWHASKCHLSLVLIVITLFRFLQYASMVYQFTSRTLPLRDRLHAPHIWRKPLTSFRCTENSITIIVVIFDIIWCHSSNKFLGIPVKLYFSKRHCVTRLSLSMNRNIGGIVQRNVNWMIWKGWIQYKTLPPRVMRIT